MEHRKSMMKRFLLGTLLSQFLVFSAQATSIDVSIDTSSLMGTDALIVFDLVAGDGTTPNSVRISNFLTDGLLGSAGFAGNASGTIPGTPILYSTDFFNEMRQTITFGEGITFHLDISRNIDIDTTTPDAFSIFLLDTLGNPLFNTTDPTGSNALFQFDITGERYGRSNLYRADPDISNPVTWGVGVVIEEGPKTERPIPGGTPTSNVPEPSVLLLLATGLIGFGVKRKNGNYA